MTEKKTVKSALGLGVEIAELQEREKQLKEQVEEQVEEQRKKHQNELEQTKQTYKRQRELQKETCESTLKKLTEVGAIHLNRKAKALAIKEKKKDCEDTHPRKAFQPYFASLKSNILMLVLKCCGVNKEVKP